MSRRELTPFPGKMTEDSRSALPGRKPTDKRVAIVQSNYLPWKGYFDIIHDADLFVFYDDVQFTKNDWRNRNQIKSLNGLEWLTIPVGKNENRRINEVRIPPDSSWTKHHWQRIEASYQGAEYFKEYGPWLRGVLLHERWETLSALNQHIIRTISQDFLGVSTSFVRSQDFAISGQKQERLLSLLESLGASTYISGPAAKNYLEPARFAEVGINVEWKDYSGYPEYPQQHPPFVHTVSIVDLLFCTGPRASYYICGWRSARPPAAILPGHEL